MADPLFQRIIKTIDTLSLLSMFVLRRREQIRIVLVDKVNSVDVAKVGVQGIW